MRKTIKNKILISILAMSSINLFASAEVFAVDVTVDDNKVTSHNNQSISDFNGYNFINDNYNYNNITVSNSTLGNFYGINLPDNAGEPTRSLTNNNITINGSTINGNITGIKAATYNLSATGLTLTLKDTTVNSEVVDGEVVDDEDVNRGKVVGADLSSYSKAITVNNIKIVLEGNTNINNADVILFRRSTWAQYSVNMSDCEIILRDNADVSTSNLYAFTSTTNILPGNLSSYKPITPQNTTLTLDGWSGSVKGVYKFNNIDFNKINWVSGGTVLNIKENSENGALANTNINLNNLNFEGGAELKAGESMTIISNNNSGKNLGIGTGKGKVDALSNFTAGVSIEGTGKAEVASDGNSVKYTLTEVKHLDQIDLVAENRAASAAFVNQGTDLISDSLDTISRDDNYGVKTFAAVHGNRSKYDVNSDIKINGWSVIAGVGNADKFDNGSEFSWSVFYENGSGNYRTYNSFNNEFFRGDGSLVYNGGGIAARYTNKNGVYTEGSLRAGMLKSDMDNALRDGAGNFYGYESESAYYGAHIGIGKIISLSESSDLDIYGKFFHTYTGDSFKVANDEFEFDSINSDRLRIGARITSNKENKFSTYYGLAYEYEFNGDADMTAQGLKAPTQSLQGSSIMAEVGFNYQPTPDSPWSFDLNMRGYAGERQGGSFNVQATYTF